MLTKFRQAVQARDYQLIAQHVREYANVTKLTEREIYRIALSAEPGLSQDTWQDIVQTAMERHPAA